MIQPGRVVLWALVVLVALLVPQEVRSQAPAQPGVRTNTAARLALVLGKSVLVESPVPIKRASLAEPLIADVMVLSPKQIYVIGKAVGTTNLTLWEKGDRISKVFDLVVSPDLIRLKEQLHELLPEETAIRVTASHDSIALSGSISSSASLAQTLAIAETYAPKKVLNLVQVGGVHQVMLEVRVAEMNRALTRRLGINMNAVNGQNDFGVTKLNNLTNIVPPNQATLLAGPLGYALGQTVNSLFRFQTGSLTWTGFIDALKQDDLVKVLAEPTLVALSGQEASFLAGGEFPVPVPQAFGVVTIQWKKFGVSLNFQPTVLGPNRISMTVSPEVSELDFASGVNIQSFQIPALTTRRASTVIELADGQSFAIAGLLKDNVREIINRFPVLGDIPVLGALFRSSSFQKNETELIIIATPHLVKPIDVASQPLPTSAYLESSDTEFYLMGKLAEPKPDAHGSRRSSRQDRPGMPAGMEGDFGYITP
jgi:pilus assembly protein CpaC